MIEASHRSREVAVLQTNQADVYVCALILLYSGRLKATIFDFEFIAYPMRILCLANNKGGVTKTTTTIQLGYGLARAGYRVLIIDADAQGNSTYSVLGRQETERTLFDVLMGQATLLEVMRSTEQAGLYIVPSSIALSAADLLLAAATGRELRIARALSAITTQFDFILIDTPPTLGVMTVNALVACTDVIIPVALTTYALLGIQILEETMQELRENMNIALPVLGVVANLDDHTRMSQEILAAVREHFGDLVFDSVIPRNIKVEEAQNQAQSIYAYDPKSTGAKAYEGLLAELLTRLGEPAPQLLHHVKSHA